MKNFQSFIANPDRRFSRAGPVIQVSRNENIQKSTDGSSVFKYRTLKCATKISKMGGFLLVYSYNDDGKPFLMDKYVQWKGNGSSGASSSVCGGRAEV